MALLLGRLHEHRCAALRAALQQQAINEDVPAVLLMDLDVITRTIDHVQTQAGYPQRTLHTYAVKANPVGKLLEIFKEKGFGAEAASLGELAQAIHVGFEPDRIVFDSPAKTVSELRYALSAGVRMNLDNFQELQRVADLLAREPQLLRPGAFIGLRVNPQVGAGSIEALSTGGLVSKFGFPLTEVAPQLVDAFRQHPWLNMLHLHVGSQGLPTQRIVEGVARVWALARDVERCCGEGRVAALDIGGGLSVDFDSDEDPPVTRFQEQAALLRAAVPALFEPGCRVQLLTENGRALVAKAGCCCSRVEYTKASGGRRIAVTHVGADLFMRACYLPDTWGLRLFVCDGEGRPKEPLRPPAPARRQQGDDGGGGQAPHGEAAAAAAAAAGAAGAAAEAVAAGASSAAAAGEEEALAANGASSGGLVEQDVAGPLCFQGDRLAVARPLPPVEVGDYVVVADTGAYCLSMWSRYNSRSSPPVYGFSSAGAADGAVQLVKLRAGDTLQQVLDFWNQL